MNPDETIAALVTELAHLRATVAQQQEAISALRTATASATDETQAQAEAAGKRSAVGRRGLLLAAAGAAGATVATAALGAHQEVLAATGDSLLLGQSNDADATTNLTPTASTTPSPLLFIDNSSSAASGGQGLVSHGSSTNGMGVVGGGLGNGGFGVFGSSDTGIGVAGATSAGIDLAAFGNGILWQNLQAQSGPPTSGSHRSGEAIRDANGELWLCVGAGAPGTWVQMAHAFIGMTGGVTNFLSKPIRLLDTRGGDSLALQDGGGPITGGDPTGPAFPLTVAGVNWQLVSVPANAVGAIGNVTVVAGGAGGGYLAIVPHSAGYSGTATLAFGPNQVVSNSFTTGLTSGQLDILIGGTSTNVILDLIAVIA